MPNGASKKDKSHSFGLSWGPLSKIKTYNQGLSNELQDFLPGWHPL